MNIASIEKHGNGQLHLPKIVHPALRVQDTSQMNISARSVSRASSLGTLADKYSKEKPSDNKQVQLSEKTPMRFDMHRENQFNSASSDFKYVIPEGVNVVYTPDTSKITIPIFGPIQLSFLAKRIAVY
jgi:hypothetical protein